MNAKEVRRRLQSQYDRGNFTSRDELISFGVDRGWVIKRNSLNYITFEHERWDGPKKRVRIKVEFDDEEEFAKFKLRQKQLRILSNPYRRRAYFSEEPHSLSNYDIRWVYVLFARTATEAAAYVGHTSRVSARLRGHLRSKSTQKSSGPLQTWATNHGIVLNFAVVGLIHGHMGKSEATRQATLLEGFWAQRAKLNGVKLPGEEGWGQFPPQPHDLDFQLGWEMVLDIAKPVSEIVDKVYDFNQICIADIAVSKIQEKYKKQWELLHQMDDLIRL